MTTPFFTIAENEVKKEIMQGNDKTQGHVMLMEVISS